MTNIAYQPKKDIWENVWKDYRFDTKNDLRELNWTKSQRVWKLLEQFLEKEHQDFKNKKVIELGCGRATDSLLLAQKGAQITLLDSNDLALKLARQRFKYYNLENNLKLIKSNIFDLKRDLWGKFDISLSSGLVEHFAGEERGLAVLSHYKVLKKDGITIISVPNRFCLPYRFWMKREKLLNKWPYGQEIPFSPKELKGILKKNSFKIILMTGSSVINDLFTLFVPPKFNKIRSTIITTPIDIYLGHIITIVGRKFIPSKS